MRSRNVCLHTNKEGVCEDVFNLEYVKQTYIQTNTHTCVELETEREVLQWDGQSHKDWQIFRRDGQGSPCGEDGIEDLKEIFKSFMLQKERETVTLAEKVNDINTWEQVKFINFVVKITLFLHKI